MDGGILQTIGELVKLTPRTGFALAAGAVSTWLLVHYGIINNDVVQLGIGYVGCVGFFVWFYSLMEKLLAVAGRGVKRWATWRREAVAQRRAVANIDHLVPAEAAALKWMHHRQQFRIRGDRHNRLINNLVNLNLLVRETPLSIPTIVFSSCRGISERL